MKINLEIVYWKKKFVYYVVKVLVFCEFSLRMRGFGVYFINKLEDIE